jgi:hypothetical protein
MQVLIDQYFDKCKPSYEKDGDGKVLVNSKTGIPLCKTNPPTITGLALYLGFSSRQSMYDYESKEEYSYTIKRARLRCENWLEENLLSGNIQAAAGIFALKNYGWRDQQNIEIESPDFTDATKSLTELFNKIHGQNNTNGN